MSEKQQIKLTFLGGADSIGASCTLVEVDNTCLLIDCGIRMNAPDRPLPDLSALDGKQIDAILLTHAHTDHTGALPVLCDAFSSVPVIATAPTLDLIAILFKDAIKIIEKDRDGEVPLYSRVQVENVFTKTVPVGFRQPRVIKNVTVTFLPASHIIGAAMIHIATPAGNILFTGDYSVTAAGTMPALDKPVLPVDLLISESTYGTRLHEDRVIAENRLIQQVGEILQRSGKVLIPSFAVGRAQEVILILQKALRSKKIPSVPVYVDGMVREVCSMYGNYETYVTSTLAKQIRKTSNPFFTDTIKPVDTPQMRSRISSEKSCVIVASSGMLTGGASAFYARTMLGNEQDGILLTGYQDEESPGRKLLSLASNSANRTFEMFGEPIEVKATMATFNLSAHADRLQMASLIESVRPRTVVLVHGDNEARTALKNTLQTHDCVLVNNGESITRSYPVRRSATAIVADLPEENDIMRVRAIVGAPGKGLVKASDAAQLWFGCKADAAQIDMFVQRIETLSIVRRDDVRRNYLQVLSPEDGDTDSPEFQLECRLKNENPKGKLLEYCMKSKIEFPSFEIESAEGYFHVRAKISIDEKVIESKSCRALSKKTAQQLAAEDLLLNFQNDAVAKSEEEIVGEVVEIDDQKKNQLKSDNLKGKLYAFCAANKIKVPAVYCKMYSGNHSVKFKDHRSAFETAWFSSPVKIVAEHAASEAFLEYLESLSESNIAGLGTDINDTDDAFQTSKTGNDPRILLNNFLQTKQLLGFGYELTGTETVENRTLFSVSGWAVLPDNTRIESSSQSAFSKKDAQYRAAAEILEKIYTLD